MPTRNDNRLTVIEAIPTADWQRTVIEAWSTHPGEKGVTQIMAVAPGQSVQVPEVLPLNDDQGRTGVVTNLRIEDGYLVGDYAWKPTIFRFKLVVEGRHEIAFGSLVSRESKRYLQLQHHEKDTVKILRLAREVKELPALP